MIVGGSTGLGLSAAKACVAEGASCVIVGRKQESLDNALSLLGSRASGVHADASDPSTAPSAIELARQKFGGFHGLYHVAGGSGRRFGDGPLHELTDEGLDQTLNLNFKSLVYSNRAAVRQFLSQKSGGAILNMASVLARSPAPKFFATHAYASAKAAIVGLTQSAAAYYAPANVRFNAVAPGLVDTPMAQRAVSDETIVEYVRKRQPLDGGRPGIPEDLDAAAVWLLSDESKFVTGQLIAIDGGWSVFG